MIRTLIVVGTALTACLALGWLAYHYAAATEQFFRWIMAG